MEFSEPAAMVSAAAALMTRRHPEHTLVLFALQDQKEIMVISGSKPSPAVEKEIVVLKKKLQKLPETAWQIIRTVRNLNPPSAASQKAENNCGRSLTIAALSDHKAPRLLLFSTFNPTAQEQELLTYCLKHLDKRLSEARSFFELERMNRLDSLTGLNNRGHFDEIIKRESLRGDRYRHPTSLIMLDLDHFKKINDTFGHQTGDQVLQTIGRLLLAEVRQSDTPCRYGGEEFAIILPETGLDEACKIGERFRRIIEQQTLVTHKNVTLKITASLGIASTQESQNIDLVAAADRALYLAKNSGRNQVATTSTTPESAARQRIRHCFPIKHVLNGSL
ncbi:MAG: GGDEF domain-containing protein [Deltaproteobacteria bacterium]|nr:GGDEF domain-containing protein [Deltaproteobacteria bacterium]